MTLPRRISHRQAILLIAVKVLLRGVKKLSRLQRIRLLARIKIRGIRKISRICKQRLTRRIRIRSRKLIHRTGQIMDQIHSQRRIQRTPPILKLQRNHKLTRRIHKPRLTRRTFTIRFSKQRRQAQLFPSMITPTPLMLA